MPFQKKFGIIIMKIKKGRYSPMNYNDIAAMLAAGKSADEIAKEFTDALNKATAEQKAAEEAKKAEDAKSKKMDEISMAIAHALNEYAAVAGVEMEKLRGAEVRELLDKFLPVMDWLKNVEVKVSTSVPKKLNSFDDILRGFWKEYNI